MKCKVITGQFDNLPPLNSVGRAELLWDSILFVPDQDEHLPLGYSREHFSGYLMQLTDIQLVEV